MKHNKQIKEMSELTFEQNLEIQKIAKIGYWEANLKTGELFWSQVIFDIFGYDADNFVPTLDKFKKAIHPDDMQLVFDSEMKSEITGLHDVIHRIITPNGNIKYVHELAKRYAVENVSILRGTVQDVTEYKLAQEKIENLLKEKETIIKEIHHRIKNSLQQIYSLLGIQAENSAYRFNSSEHTDGECQSELQKIIADVRQRILSMSIIHQILYKENINEVNFMEFLNQLILNIKLMYSELGKNIKVNISGDRLDLCLEHIIPCGLIVNEIISNSFKHAFINKGGNINIELKLDESINIIKISDDGVGMDEETLKFNNGFGLSLVYGLTKQINGKIKLEYDSSGTRYEIKFDKKYLRA